MTLQGAPQLKSRLAALKEVWKPIARSWAKADVQEMRPRVPVRTGRLRRSFRVLSVSGKRARVGGHFTAYFVDAGPKPHAIKARRTNFLVFRDSGRTIFARKVHSRGYRGRPFRLRAAQEALRKNPMAEQVIDAWNRGA